MGGEYGVLLVGATFLEDITLHWLGFGWHKRLLGLKHPRLVSGHDTKYQLSIIYEIEKRQGAGVSA